LSSAAASHLGFFGFSPAGFEYDDGGGTAAQRGCAEGGGLDGRLEDAGEFDDGRQLNPAGQPATDFGTRQEKFRAADVAEVLLGTAPVVPPDGCVGAGSALVPEPLERTCG